MAQKIVLCCSTGRKADMCLGRLRGALRLFWGGESEERVLERGNGELSTHQCQHKRLCPVHHPHLDSKIGWLVMCKPPNLRTSVPRYPPARPVLPR